MNSVNDKTKKMLLVGGSVLLVIAALVFGGPVLAASSWKSGAIDKTNALIDKINATNRDISNLSSKLQPTEDDYKKLTTAFTTQMSDVKTAKNDLAEIGGIPGIDITGSYTKAVNARKELVAAYDELVSLDTVGLERAKAEQEVSKLVGGSAPQTEEQAKAAVENIKMAASKIKEFANSSNGTDYDKRSAVAFEKLAAALEKSLNATDEAAASAAEAELTNVSEEIDALQSESTDVQKAFQKKIDDNIDRLNKAVKSLE